MVTADRTDRTPEDFKEDNKNYVAMAYIQSKVDKKTPRIDKSPSKKSPFTGFEINKGVNKKSTLSKIKQRAFGRTNLALNIIPRRDSSKQVL